MSGVWIVPGFVEGWLYGGGWGGVVAIVAVFGGRGWEVVVVGEAGAVVPVHPSGGRGCRGRRVPSRGRRAIRVRVCRTC